MSKKLEGLKYDEGKPRLDLIPYDVLAEVSKVLTFGAEKYDARNWEKGMNWGRVFAAAQRHMIKFWQYREEKDEETSLSHLSHAICCLMFLHAYELRGIGLDDRPE